MGSVRSATTRAASRDKWLNAFEKSSWTTASVGHAARWARSSCSTRSHALRTPTPCWWGVNSAASVSRTVRARADPASLRSASGIPMGLSLGSQSAASPPGLRSSIRSAPARAARATGGMRFTAASPVSSSRTPTRASLPPSASADRCSTRCPGGPGEDPRSAARMASVTVSRDTVRGTASLPAAAAREASSAANAASTEAAVARSGEAVGKSRRTFLQISSVPGASGSDNSVRAAALRRPWRVCRSARRCVAVVRRRGDTPLPTPGAKAGAAGALAPSPLEAETEGGGGLGSDGGRPIAPPRSARATANSRRSTAAARAAYDTRTARRAGRLDALGWCSSRDGSRSSHRQACSRSGSVRLQSLRG